MCGPGCIALSLAKGLATDYAIGEAWGILGGIFTGAEEAAPPPDEEKPASTVTHQIKHTSFWAALAGAVVGAIVAGVVYSAATALAGLVIVGTGGVAAVAVAAVGVGAVVACNGVISWASRGVTNFVDSFFPADDGPVNKGSPDIFVRGLAAARAGVDTVACVKHSTPPLIAEGSETVIFNGWHAARVDVKTACGATLKQGEGSVLIGGPKTPPLVEIGSEFSLLERALLVGVEFLIPPSRGFLKGLKNLPKYLGKAKNATVQLLGKAKNLIVNGLKKGPQLLARARNALTKGWNSFKGALRGILGGKCSTCKDKSRSDGGDGGCHSGGCKGGDPIDLASGAVVETRHDFTLGHHFCVDFLRAYDGARDHHGELGRGWLDSFSEQLQLSFGGDRIELFTVHGERVIFDFSPDRARVFNRRFPHYTLAREPGGFSVHDLRDNRTRHFHVRGACGVLVALVDPHGNRVDLDYRGDALVAVRHSEGPTVAIRRARDAQRGRTFVTYERTDLGAPRVLVRYTLEGDLLAEAQSTSGFHLFYRYDEQGRMIRWSDTAKTWATYEYDARGRVVRSRAAEGLYSVDLDYDESSRTTRVRDGKGHRSVYSFNEHLQLVAHTDPLGRTETFEYDRHGLLVGHADPAGHRELREYDPASGVLTRLIDREGRAAELFYDEELRVVAVADPLGQAWRYERGPAGEILAAIAPEGSRHDYHYDPKGRLVRITRTGGAARTLTYDAQGRLLEETDWLGHPHRYTYDDAGRLSEATDPIGRREHLFYDPRDRLAALEHADGSRRTFVHDEEHNLTERVDEKGHRVRAEYGAFDLPRASVDPVGRRYEFAHDPDHILLTRVRAPDGRDYVLERDPLGRVVREVDYHGSATRYTYDLAGNLAERTNALGQTVRYTYDRNGALVKLEADGQTTTFERDALGRLVRAQNPACSLAWTYDALGRVVQSVQDGDIVDHTHDAAGLRASRTLRPGLWQKLPHSTRYVHDAEGRLARLEVGRAALEIRRDAVGSPTCLLDSAGFRLEQAYDARGNLTLQQIPGPPDHEGRPLLPPVLERRYAYDVACNLTSVHDARWGLTEYSHDPSDRVLSARRPRAGEENFRYTATGLLAHVHQRTPEAERALDLHYDGDGRLGRLGDQSHSHDAAGRLVRRTLQRKGFRPQTWEYQWDSLDQLVEVRTPEGLIWRYSYDALGRRVRKYNPSTRESVHFTWDGDVLLREVVLRPRGPRDNQQIVQIVHWQHEPGTFVPLARQEGDQLAYVVTDQLGTPRELVAPDGSILWRTHHAVWGARLAGDPGTTCPIRFQGQYEDPETGLYYNRFRYYDPTTALYLSPDPIGLLGGLQPHAYVHNPTTWIDPYGLAGCPKQAQNKVRKGQGPRDIHRIDAPEQSVPGSQWHAHQSQMKDGKRPALNQDGSYHDGKPDFSKKTLKWLEEHGWTIPDELW